MSADQPTDWPNRTPVPLMPPVPGFQERGALAGSSETTYTEPPAWN